MKPVLLEPFFEIFDYYKPTTICEIGTHDGKSAVQFVDHCLQYQKNLKYTGYDIFDAVKSNEKFHAKEVNGKGAGKFTTAKNNLRHRQKKKNKFSFELIVGFTKDTLVESTYDFVYIDGGHSYKTVKQDYEKLKTSKVIVFDDYQINGVARFFDELVETNNIPKVEWNNVWKHKKPCWAFMPHSDKVKIHVQPVIFNA